MVLVNDLSAKFPRPNNWLVGKSHQRHHEVRSHFFSFQLVHKPPCSAKIYVRFPASNLYVSSHLNTNLKYHKRQHCPEAFSYPTSIDIIRYQDFKNMSLHFILYSDCVLNAWPHHEYKKAATPHRDEIEERLLCGSPQATTSAVQKSKRDYESYLHRRRSIGSRVASKFNDIFVRPY